MVVTDIADLQRLAEKRLPKIIATYVENGGYEEETLHRNRSALEHVELVPRVLNDVSKRSLSVQMAGMNATMPVALAPVGACGLTYPNAEVEAARAAKEFGIPFCLSTLSIATLEDVAKATRAPFWFQLYVMREKRVGEALIERAYDAGCSALLLSMDLHVRSQRHGEQKLGLVAPPRTDLRNIVDVLTHLRWLISMVRSKHRTFGNLVGLVPHAKSVAKVTEWLETQFDPTLSNKDIEHIRKRWPRKLFVKGILHPEDARSAIEHGADGVIVSNHGGRQVDGAIATAEVLPRIVDAVCGKGEVFVDSGIRSGIDVLRMMGLGANGCLIGRAYLYGLAWNGKKGVLKALEIICKELDQNMALCGVRDIKHLPADLLFQRLPA